MSLHIFHKKKQMLLSKADLKESALPFSNPFRGWYRLYAFDLSQTIDPQELHWSVCQEEQLALVRISIAAYQGCNLDQQALEHLQQIFDFWQSEHKQLIVRIVYDTEGKGMQREPMTLRQVQRHMEQIGPVLRDHAEQIYTLQGLFIGSWGEMHHSRFTGEQDLKELMDTLDHAVGQSCYQAVRTPSYRRALIRNTERSCSEASLSCRLGLYNDGMLASDTDYGTYTDSEWNRGQELAYQNQMGLQVPNGGEVIVDNEYNDLLNAVNALEQMQVSYLHSVYDPAVIEKWKQTLWNGKNSNQQSQTPDVFLGQSGFDYIGAHLGYRYYVSACELIRKKGQQFLSITILNQGFSCCYQEMQVELVVQKSSSNTDQDLKQEGEKQNNIVISLDSRVRDWRPGKTTILTCAMQDITSRIVDQDQTILTMKTSQTAQTSQTGRIRLYLRLYCPAAKQWVQLANVYQTADADPTKNNPETVQDHALFLGELIDC